MDGREERRSPALKGECLWGKRKEGLIGREGLGL